ncbi:GNAT family N-acetyltransferase [Streptomyces sp. NPDC005908]|uniref:GNAT family N-acetyltransferase n=1 Tax=unclassified Streptomyces TaxID=2593676 RepID=UPI0011A89576|nr:GNAT family N-acetyltransferase [Streptomyces sp. T12]TWD22719.1 diamine N-acetyltransferase [Streptomyces sp. T12]
MTTTRAPRLEELTPANLEAALALRVRPEQEFAVHPVADSLAEAYVRPRAAWPRLIVDGDRVVGFVMAFLDIDWRDDGTDIRSGLWRLNIAADEQGKGYGRFAVDAVAEELRRRGTKTLHVTWHPGEHGPENFYLTLGFEKTDEKVDEEHVGVLPL